MATTTWRATDLSVEPPAYQLADDDREAFAFDAEQTIDGATAVLTDLTTGEPFVEGIEGVVVAGEVATVTVSGLSRGATYELAVTFTAAGGGRTWTRTLILEVVA